MRFPIPKLLVSLLLIINLIGSGVIIYINEQTVIAQSDENICEEGDHYELLFQIGLTLPITYYMTLELDSKFASSIEDSITEWHDATSRQIFVKSLSLASASLIITREYSPAFGPSTLAYAGIDPYLKYDGKLHLNFNPEKTFADLAFSCELLDKAYEGPFDIRAVGVHELGHILGLAHNSDEFTTMHEYYIGTFMRTLSDGDIAGFNYLY